MHLQRVGEHDQHNDCGAANRGGDGGSVLSDDVAANVVTEREVARDGDEDVNGSRAAVASKNDGGGAEEGGIVDLVEDGEHVLVAGVGEDDDGERAQGGD